MQELEDEFGSGQTKGDFEFTLQAFGN